MSDKTTMLYNLRMKCAPMQNPEGDKRYWYSDAYGFTDDFGTPIADATNGPYGPPQMRTSGGDTGRFAGSLVGTLARLQGYDADNAVWRRVAVTDTGALKTDIATAGEPIDVNVLPPVGDYVSTLSTVDNITASDIAGAVAFRSYLRIDVTGGNIWVRFDGTAEENFGILVTPTMPFSIEGNICPTQAISAFGSAAAVDVTVTQRRAV